MSTAPRLVLGIETSCDETSVAILDNGRILDNETYTQEIHSQYGGVVPEVASRAHLAKIEPLSRSVLDRTKLTLDQIDLIAVTDRPGLAGALLVGIGFALGIHTARGTPITGINHLEGHISSVFLEHPDFAFPFLALVVSGGHTSIYHVEKFGSYRCLGSTVDDAAGEAFDKVGKLIGFPYPAGRAIEQASAACTDPGTLKFPVARVASGTGMDFSFSGLKTAVRYYLAGKDEAFIAANRPAVCRAFQNAAVESLVNGIAVASRETGINRVALVGGVACNKALRAALTEKFGDNVKYPSPGLCTDNAAMIAMAGFRRSQCGLTRPPRLDPAARL
jgi:N6-L-threonylcarbamoyladenine synthase